MNLYHISQTVNRGYNTYSDAVVAAKTAEDACRIDPSECYKIGKDDHWFFQYADGSQEDSGICPQWGDWCAVKDVQCVLIGKATSGTKEGVICASYHAG